VVVEEEIKNTQLNSFFFAAPACPTGTPAPAVPGKTKKKYCYVL